MPRDHEVGQVQACLRDESSSSVLVHLVASGRGPLHVACTRSHQLHRLATARRYSDNDHAVRRMLYISGSPQIDQRLAADLLTSGSPHTLSLEPVTSY